MRPSGVVEADPFSDDTGSVLLGYEAMTMYALLPQRSDHAFDHPVLLRAVRCDQLVSKLITAHHPRLGP